MAFQSVRVKEEDKKLFDDLVGKWDRANWKLFHQMVTYFTKTGYDPAAHEQDDVTKQLDKFKSTIISFIRKQEKDIIVPLAGKIDSIVLLVPQILEALNNANYGLIDDASSDSPEKPSKTNTSGDFTTQALSEELREATIAEEKATREVKRYRELLDSMEKAGKFKGKAFVVDGMNEDIRHIFKNKASLRS